MIRIALTYTGSEQKHQNYIRWLQAYTGDTVDIITCSAAAVNAADIASCDGVVFSGGADIHPRFYEARTGYVNQPDEFEEDRDEFEIALFHRAQALQLPVLGICRGLQLINCIYGGTLLQDMGEKSNETHKAVKLVDKLHKVMIEPGTLLAAATIPGMQEVNSAHHQAPDRIGSGLRISARAADGIVEGLERTAATNLPFLLAVHWHPERMYAYQLAKSPASASLRDYFLQEVTLHKHQS